MVGIFLKIPKKNKIRVPMKRNGPLFTRHGATVPHKMPYSQRELSLCLRRQCERQYKGNLREYRAKNT